MNTQHTPGRLLDALYLPLVSARHIEQGRNHGTVYIDDDGESVKYVRATELREAAPQLLAALRRTHYEQLPQQFTFTY